MLFIVAIILAYIGAAMLVDAKIRITKERERCNELLKLTKTLSK